MTPIEAAFVGFVVATTRSSPRVQNKYSSKALPGDEAECAPERARRWIGGT
jgi:hypothetical protein